MSEIERKFQMFECGCALRRGCTLHGTLEGYVKESMLDTQADLFGDKLDALETQLAEKQKEIGRLEVLLNSPIDEAFRHLVDKQAKLEAVLAEKTAALQQREEMIRAVKYSVVDTVGGTDYEGNPTSELNYLQRLRILVAAEEQVKAKDVILAKYASLLKRADGVLGRYPSSAIVQDIREALKGEATTSR